MVPFVYSMAKSSYHIYLSHGFHSIDFYYIVFVLWTSLFAVHVIETAGAVIVFTYTVHIIDAAGAVVFFAYAVHVIECTGFVIVI